MWRVYYVLFFVLVAVLKWQWNIDLIDKILDWIFIALMVIYPIAMLLFMYAILTRILDKLLK